MAHRNRWFTWVYLLKMGIFHGYVKEPEGTSPIVVGESHHGVDGFQGHGRFW